MSDAQLTLNGDLLRVLEHKFTVLTLLLHFTALLAHDAERARLSTVRNNLSV